MRIVAFIMAVMMCMAALGQAGMAGSYEDDQRKYLDDRSKYYQGQQSGSEGNVFVNEACHNRWNAWTGLCCQIYKTKDECVSREGGRPCKGVNGAEMQRRYEEKKKNSTTQPAC